MGNKTPMELLKGFAPEFAKNQMDEKALIFENEKYQKVPNKYKMLACLPVGRSELELQQLWEAILVHRCGLKWLNKIM
ncbi:MAG: hypothetical protein K9J16_00505 [Melioribacteraceae bacterium]|nr:hypothetical protein [Melioribacteraceae bacterium]MCF8354072.1 hypothetical protein [Melioribacteraceae bacterium]MCF8393744.1 hypothetical protein [Melioribacteraceae bacterium]MCF8419488.1 hypothetical protein [Melioribacteraceae bacterium]